MKNVEITLKSGAFVTSRMTDANAETVSQSKYDEKDYFMGQNIYIRIPYDKEKGQDGLVTTSRDIEAVKIIDGDDTSNADQVVWLVMFEIGGEFGLLQDVHSSLLTFPSFAEAKHYLDEFVGAPVVIVDLLTADHHMQAGLLTGISAKQLKEYEDGRKG